MVSVGINVQLPKLLLVAALVVVELILAVDAVELLLVLLLLEPPPQLIKPVAPIRLNSPSVPSVLRRSLSTVLFAVFALLFVFPFLSCWFGC